MLSARLQGQRGATLIEVLIALLVLSIGLLGMAGLQSQSIKVNHSAYYRSQATFLAYDIAERMRANRDVALAGGYAVDFPASTTSNTQGSGDLATQDKAQWLNVLASRLPNGTGKIAHTGLLFEVSVRWDDSRGALQSLSNEQADAAETFVYWTEL